MTTATALLDMPGASTSAGTFANWGGFSAMLTAAGLTRTADTGQIVWSAAMAVPGINAMYGYEIRTWNDGYGALYMRWEYWLATSSLRPYCKITIGTGSDGAGNITGQLFGGQMSIGDTGQMVAGTPYLAYACLTDGAFTIAYTCYMTNSASTLPHWFIFERRRDPDTGAVVAGGHFSYRCFGSAIAQNWSATYSTTDASCLYTQFTPYANSGAPSSYYHGDSPLLGGVEAMPIYSSWPRPAMQQCCLFLWGPDIPVGAVFTAIVGGAVRQYVVIGKNNLTYRPFGTSAATGAVALAMLWE